VAEQVKWKKVERPLVGVVPKGIYSIPQYPTTTETAEFEKLKEIPAKLKEYWEKFSEEVKKKPLLKYALIGLIVLVIILGILSARRRL